MKTSNKLEKIIRKYEDNPNVILGDKVPSISQLKELKTEVEELEKNKLEGIEIIQKAYEKVADSILELIRTKLILEKSPEEYMVHRSYNRFRDKSDILKMLIEKE